MNIKILNWDKYQGESKRYESTSWFRVENTVWMHPLWDELSDSEFRAMIFVWSYTSQKAHKTGETEIVPKTLHRMSGIPEFVLISTIKKLCDLKVMECDFECSPGEHGEVTVQAPGEHGEVTVLRNVTNVTNDTNDTNVTVSAARGAGTTPGSVVWNSYSSAYQQRYGVCPARNAKQNSLCKQLTVRLPLDEAAGVAQFYLALNGFYATRAHSLDLLVQDCEKIRTEWITGKVIRSSRTQAELKSEANAELFARVSRGEI